jgi:uncharacterized protein (TIGR02594 family)
MTDPSWIAKARGYVGVREVPGSKHNPTIVSLWSKIGGPFRDEETNWCAGFPSDVFEEVGIRSSRSAAARSYLKWGVKLATPAVGAVVVSWRGSKDGWSGHVGFVVGKGSAGILMVLAATRATWFRSSHSAATTCSANAGRWILRCRVWTSKHQRPHSRALVFAGPDEMKV